MGAREGRVAGEKVGRWAGAPTSPILRNVRFLLQNLGRSQRFLIVMGSKLCLSEGARVSQDSFSASMLLLMRSHFSQTEMGKSV